MLSTSDIVKWINERLAPVIKGGRFFGIAKIATRGTSTEPYIDEKFIGVDDTYPATIYHRLTGLSTTTNAGTGYGDSDAFLQNTYQLSLFVYFNEKKCGLTTEKLYTLTQATITGILKSNGYRSLRVSVQSAVLNDTQVWRQEYGDAPYKLSDQQRLVQINYSIIAVFDPKCITIPQC